MTRAYYNEIDADACAWLRELIRCGHIAPGDVDERSIADVTPADLAGYTQCHFFAGIGVWSYALRQSGWPDDRPVWTGSCPCQPFSSAGKGRGFADERHLWPAFQWLIRQCRPDIVFGEQVASKDGRAWLDVVRHEMECEGYACGVSATMACGFGAPHKRQRLYWVADAERHGGRADQPQRQEEGRVVDGRAGEAGGLADNAGQRRTRGRTGQESSGAVEPGRLCDVGRLADLQREGLEGHAGDGDGSDEPGRLEADQAGPIAESGDSGGMAASERDGRRADEQERRQEGGTADGRAGEAGGLADALPTGRTKGGTTTGRGPTAGGSAVGELADWAGQRLASYRPGPTNGFWRDVDWLFCRDGMWRAARPGSFTLAHGAPARVVRLRGYGNAIVAEQAKGFIEAYMDVQDAARAETGDAADGG